MLVLAATGAVTATAMFGDVTVPAVQVDPIRPEIGSIARAGDLHVIRRPGLYGVSVPAAGMQYAVIGDSLVRIDAESHVIRAIIRNGVRPID